MGSATILAVSTTRSPWSQTTKSAATRSINKWWHTKVWTDNRLFCSLQQYDPHGSIRQSVVHGLWHHGSHNTIGNLKSIIRNGMGKTVTVATEVWFQLTFSESLSFPTKSRPLSLNFVLVTPSILKNLIYVRRFTKDNSSSVEFDPFGFSVKDLHTKKMIFRSDSTWDLYPIHLDSNKRYAPSAFTAITSSNWHNRLVNPSNQTLKLSSFF